MSFNFHVLEKETKDEKWRKIMNKNPDGTDFEEQKKLTLMTRSKRIRRVD